MWTFRNCVGLGRRSKKRLPSSVPTTCYDSLLGLGSSGVLGTRLSIAFREDCSHPLSKGLTAHVRIFALGGFEVGTGFLHASRCLSTFNSACFGPTAETDPWTACHGEPPLFAGAFSFCRGYGFMLCNTTLLFRGWSARGGQKLSQGWVWLLRYTPPHGTATSSSALVVRAHMTFDSKSNDLRGGCSWAQTNASCLLACPGIYREVGARHRAVFAWKTTVFPAGLVGTKVLPFLSFVGNT